MSATKNIDKTGVYTMPFGTNIHPDGHITFNLWAPDADSIDLCLYNDQNEIIEVSMNPEKNGWYSIKTDRAQTGSLYQFKIDGDLLVPDPVSRCQQKDVHGPSIVINPQDFDWGNDNKWKGLLWEETVLYELHTGTFTQEGTFVAIKEKLDYLKSLGVTAIELMPIADFPGHRNWGYDGVLAFAPDRMYGSPDDLKDLIKTAHEKGLMVFLDVVYNHFGPDGNYLYVYARSRFFTQKHKTPWGDAINFEDRTVRDFFINNALYWLNEYHFDGLRFDAIHAIVDDSKPDIVEEIAQKVQQFVSTERHVHLVLENDHNQSRYLKRDKNNNPVHHTAQWNDDFHHGVHVHLTDESSGYYVDYTKKATSKPPAYYTARSLAEGFAYQNDISHYRNGLCRGEISKGINPSAFVNFIQNHDQIGNRALGERISLLADPVGIKAAACLMLMAPSIPLLFMGEEWGSKNPFLFFCDFNEDLNAAVREGRRNEFAKFKEFSDARTRESIPDPSSSITFERSILNWNYLKIKEYNEHNEYYKYLLSQRKKYIVPIISLIDSINSQFEVLNDHSFIVEWPIKQQLKTLTVVANFDQKKITLNSFSAKNLIAESFNGLSNEIKSDKTLSSLGVCWYLD